MLMSGLKPGRVVKKDPVWRCALASWLRNLPSQCFQGVACDISVHCVTIDTTAIDSFLF